jgi:hypothetical protein
MFDPLSTPDDLSVSFGVGRRDAFAPHGTVNYDAYWVERIAFGDLWLVGEMAQVGRTVSPVAALRSPEAVVVLRDWSMVSAIHHAVLASGNETEGVKLRWNDLLAWLARGAPIPGDGAPTLVYAVTIDPADSCPSVPGKVWGELVPCSGDPRCLAEGDHCG